jgi:thioredoxin-like negative regulator of GroEL
MRMSAVALSGLVFVSAPAPAAVQPAKTALATWQQFDVWLDAIDRHAPGANDAAVRAMLGLGSAELESVFPYMVFMLRHALAGRDRPARFDEFFARYGTRGHQPPDLDRVKERIEKVLAGGIDRFLKRAAMLHADIAVLAPMAHVTVRAGIGHVVNDGRAAGDEGRPWHWLLGRAFLHLVQKRDEDPEVRLWYQAAANHLWSLRNYTELQPHIRRAMAIMPRDAEMQFVRGLMHEALGAPHIQAAVDEDRNRLSRTTPTEYASGVGSPASERAEAAKAFRSALEAEPDHHEARIRLGRILVLQDWHEQAALGLRIALARTGDRRLQYFGHLFLGRAEESRGRLDAAREAYRAAAALFPSAQSPRLSLSQMAFRAGDREEALQLLAVLSGPVDADSDPWWTYHDERTPPSGVWLDRLRRAFAEAVR